MVLPTTCKHEISAIHNICSINSEKYFRNMFYKIVKDGPYDIFLYDKRQPKLFEKVYKIHPEKADNADPDSYNY